MKDGIKPQDRIGPGKRYQLTVDHIAYAVAAALAFMLVTAFAGIKVSLTLAVIFGSGLMVYRWHKRRWP